MSLKPGIYKAWWADGGEFYNFFDGTHWCYGASTGRKLEDVAAKIAKELILGEEGLRNYTQPKRDEQPENWVLVQEWK